MYACTWRQTDTLIAVLRPPTSGEVLVVNHACISLHTQLQVPSFGHSKDGFGPQNLELGQVILTTSCLPGWFSFIHMGYGYD